MTEGLVIARQGRVGRITLDRPKALNALTLAMVHGIAAALEDFAGDDGIAAVVLDAAGERAFCAGGDIKSLYEAERGDGNRLARGFWRDEYALDHRIQTFPKPIVVLIGGIVMGGGAGLAINARFRVVDATTRFAMPETGIGLFPDVGASRFLSRMPGESGTYLSLTGESIGAADMLATGLADVFLPRADWEGLVGLLAGLETTGAAAFTEVSAVLSEISAPHATVAGPARVAAIDGLDRLFAGDSVGAIVAALQAEGSDWAVATAATLLAKSPTSQKIALRALRQGRDLPDLAAVLTMEFRIVCRIAEGRDFYEGVRAAVIDKDRQPRWQPDRLDAVSEAMIDLYFAPLGADDLGLGRSGD